MQLLPLKNRREVRSARRQRRSGSLLIPVMAVLTLLMMLLGVWLKNLAMGRQEIRQQQHQVQADYLVQSAVNRATARLHADAAYAGETWQIEPQALSGNDPVSVIIKVESVADRPQERLVQARVQLPSQGPARTQRTQKTKITLPVKETSP